MSPLKFDRNALRKKLKLESLRSSKKSESQHESDHITINIKLEHVKMARKETGKAAKSPDPQLKKMFDKSMFEIIPTVQKCINKNFKLSGHGRNSVSTFKSVGKLLTPINLKSNSMYRSPKQLNQSRNLNSLFSMKFPKSKSQLAKSHKLRDNNDSLLENTRHTTNKETASKSRSMMKHSKPFDRREQREQVMKKFGVDLDQPVTQKHVNFGPNIEFMADQIINEFSPDNYFNENGSESTQKFIKPEVSTPLTYFERKKEFKDFKIKESEIPLYMLFNDSFEKLQRFDKGNSRLKIKPVIITEQEDYSYKLPNSNLLSMEVMETGQILDVIHQKITKKKKPYLQLNMDMSKYTKKSKRLANDLKNVKINLNDNSTDSSSSLSRSSPTKSKIILQPILLNDSIVESSIDSEYKDILPLPSDSTAKVHHLTPKVEESKLKGFMSNKHIITKGLLDKKDSQLSHFRESTRMLFLILADFIWQI